MNERTKRPIRVFHGLDVHDLPPETPARRPGRHATDQPLEVFTGEESVEVTIAGQRRRVAVEGDALAADRLWSALAIAEATIEEMRAAAPNPPEKTFTLAEVKAAFMKYLDVRSDRRPSDEDKLNSWALLCSEAGLLLLGTDTLPEVPRERTPREREPAIWAAAFGAAFVRSYEDGYSVQDGTPAQRRAAALREYDAEALTQIADGAVMALHGEAPAEPAPRTKEPGWRSP